MPFLTFQSFLISLGAVFSETHVLEQGDLKEGSKGARASQFCEQLKQVRFKNMPNQGFRLFSLTVS